LIIQPEYETFGSAERYLLSLTWEEGEAMRKNLMAIAAVATLAVSSLAAPAHAQRGLGAGVAAGLIGGAIVGGALAGPGYYGPGYGYYGGSPAYVAGPGTYGDCFWQRQRFWDGYGWRVRRVRVCS
jgi:hypothetical protein